MELKEGILTRWSCRAFRPDPVPEEIIQDILTAAARSPSYANTQPWEVAVVTGKKLAELNRRRNELVQTNAPANPDMPSPQGWPVAHQERTRAFAAQRQEVMNQAKADAKAHYETTTQNSQFFGAPFAIFLLIDRTLPEWSIFDMGS